METLAEKKLLEAQQDLLEDLSLKMDYMLSVLDLLHENIADIDCTTDVYINTKMNAIEGIVSLFKVYVEDANIQIKKNVQHLTKGHTAEVLEAMNEEMFKEMNIN